MNGTRPAGRRSAAPWEAPGWRRGLQLALAAVWLLDAVLQYQTFMFSQGFPRMLAATSARNPAAVAGPVTWSAHLIGAHPGAANAAFATLQLLLALGIAWRPTTRAALAASVAWALAVWWLGEGLGRVLTGAASPVTGAPGAALLYALAAVLLWPTPKGRPERDRADPGADPTDPGADPTDPVQTRPALATQLAQVQTGPAPGSTGQAAGTGTTPAPAGPRPVLCPRLAACCQIMMGVALATC